MHSGDWDRAWLLYKSWTDQFGGTRIKKPLPELGQLPEGEFGFDMSHELVMGSLLRMESWSPKATAVGDA